MWWVIHEEAIMQALRQCHDGEDPEMVYLEMFANTEPGE